MRYAMCVGFYFWMVLWICFLELEMELEAGTGVGRGNGKRKVVACPPDAPLASCVYTVSSVCQSVCFCLLAVCFVGALHYSACLSSELVDICVNDSDGWNETGRGYISIQSR